MHPLALLLVELRVELLQIVRRLDAREIELHREHAVERRRVVAGVEERPEPLPGRGLQLAVVAVERGDRIGQFFLELPHLGGEVVDPVLADQPDAGSGYGKLMDFQKAMIRPRTAVTAL